MEAHHTIDFIGIGAAKAATTWLNECLNEHPEVLISVKELNFFNTLGGIYDKFYPRYSKGKNWYLKQFSRHSRSGLVGDFSVDYLTCNKVSGRIYENFPSVKILCCLRDPVYRAYSHYIWYRKNFRYEKSVTFLEALEKQPEYIRRSLYYQNLKPFYELFGKDQIKVVFYEDICTHPESVLKEVYHFLRVDEEFQAPSMYKVVNKAGKSKNVWVSKILLIPKLFRDIGLSPLVFYASQISLYKKLQALYTNTNVKDYEYPPLTFSDYHKAKSYFVADISNLENLLDVNIEFWNFRF